jgi:hypothetical protein
MVPAMIYLPLHQRNLASQSEDFMGGMIKFC